jgi:hypothetical protein
MTEEKKQQKQSFLSLQGIALVVVVIFVASQLYLGLTIEEIGIPGILTIKLTGPRGPQRIQLTRDFIVGNWRAKQDFDQFSRETIINYRADGTFTGNATVFQGGLGQKQFIQGRWHFVKVSDESFQLTLVSYDSQQSVADTFKIIDKNKVHNIQQNYIAVRE